MDQRNPYGLPPGNGRSAIPNAMPGQRPGGMMQQQQQHYMNEMMFDPMAMSMGNGMYHPAQHPGHPHGGYHPHAHPGHRGLPGHMQGVHHPGMMSPEEDPRFVDDIVSALGPGDLGDPVGMGDQHHLGQLPMPVYDQPHIIPPSQHQVRSQAMNQTPPQQQAPLQAPVLAPPRMNARQMHPQSMQSQLHMQAPSQLQQASGLQGVSRMAQSQPLAASGLSSMTSAPQRRQQHPPPAQSVTSSSLMAPSALVPTKQNASSVDSRALTTTSNNGSSDDELLGEDDSNKKKERRRQQVRYASRRRRKKQKDEESFLRDRIDELKEQIRIIGGDLSEQCSQMAGMSEQALTEAYEKQMQTVQTLRKDNNKLKEQLLQHENFARMIQYGLNALPSDCRDVDRKKIPGVSMWLSDQMNPLKGPTLVVDLNLCHDAVRQAYNELKNFGPSVHSKTNVCYAMGWKTELWATGTCLSFKAVRAITDKNIREVANSSWDIITSPDKCKRIYPDVKQFRVRPCGFFVRHCCGFYYCCDTDDCGLCRVVLLYRYCRR